MKSRITILLIGPVLLWTSACSQSASIKGQDEKTATDVSHDLSGKILGVYPTKDVGRIEFERAGDDAPLASHTSFKLSITLDEPAIVTKIGRDDVMLWNCDFAMTLSDRKQMIDLLEAAILQQDPRVNVPNAPGRDLLRIYARDGSLLGEHSFAGGELYDPNILMIFGEVLRFQLYQLDSNLVCDQNN